jgi:hypothetical protein
VILLATAAGQKICGLSSVPDCATALKCAQELKGLRSACVI